MTPPSFQLHLRPEYIREIYAFNYSYRTFSRKNLPALLILFASGLLLFVLLETGLRKDSVFSSLVIVISLGVGGPLYTLLKGFQKAAVIRKGSDQFIQFAEQHPQCSIVFEYNSFELKGIGEPVYFNTSNLKDTKRTALFFFIMRTDGFRLFLPKKSFQDGQFEVFLKMFDEIISHTPAGTIY